MLYLNDISLNLECHIVNSDPVEMSVEYESVNGNEYSKDELKRLIEIKLFNLGKHIKKLESPEYRERAIRILKDESIKRDCELYNLETLHFSEDKNEENVDDYYLTEYYNEKY